MNTKIQRATAAQTLRQPSSCEKEHISFGRSTGPHLGTRSCHQAGAGQLACEI